MIKKEDKKVVKKDSSREVKREKTKSSKFLQDVEFNLYIMVYLLSIVLLLISGVLFYTSELLKASNAENNALLVETQKYDSYFQVKINRYTLEEFSLISKTDIKNILDVKKFVETQGFQEITLDGFSLYSKKTQDCDFNELRNKELCKSAILEYDASGDNLITLTTGYQ